jgi:hypothetical protein
MGDRRFRWQPRLDRAWRSRSLDDAVGAGAACISGPTRDDYPELGRDHVQPLGGILADPVQAWSVPRFDVVDGPRSRQR